MCRFDRVANIFAIAQRGLAQKTAVSGAYFHAVAGVGARLFASDVELYGAVNCRRWPIGIFDGFMFGWRFVAGMRPGHS